MQPEAPESFILLPLGTIIHNGSFAQWRDGVVAVLPVLLTHENAVTRKCWPSLARIAALAGVGKDTAAEAINALERGKWLTVAREGRKSVYTMQYRRYLPGESTSSNYIRLDHNFVLGGLWAAMPASAKRLYLVLRGLAWMGHRSDGTWLPGEDEIAPEDRQPWAFLPASRLATSDLSFLSGLPLRTLRYAREWLTANRVILVSDELEGLILPFDPGLQCELVQARLQAIKEEQSRARGSALKALNSIKRTSEIRQPQGRLKEMRQPQVQDAATTGTLNGNHRYGTILESSLNNQGQSGAEVLRNSAQSLRLDLGLEAGIIYRKPRQGLPLYGGPYPVTWTPSTARAQ